MNDIIFRNEPGMLCLPCCAEAYEEEMVIGFHTKSGGKGVLSLAPESREADDLYFGVEGDEGLQVGS